MEGSSMRLENKKRKEIRALTKRIEKIEQKIRGNKTSDAIW